MIDMSNTNHCAPSAQPVHVHQLAPRQCGIVVRVEAPDSDLERLMAMGVCGGRTVELVRVGDPLILKVYGTRVGVSARLAANILVTPCPPRDCPLDPAGATP